MKPHYTIIDQSHRPAEGVYVAPRDACNQNQRTIRGLENRQAIKRRKCRPPAAMTGGVHYKAKIAVLAPLLLGLTINTAAAQENDQNVNRKGETRGDQQTNLIQSGSSASYDSSRERLQHAREALRQAANDAAQGIQEELKKAREQLDVLSGRLEEAARSAQDKTITAARQAEENLGLRVRRMEARSLLLRAKAEASLAVRAAAKNDFDRAEQRLASATELLRRARACLVDDRTYDDQVEDMEVALREASVAIKEHAKNAGSKVEKVLTDADRIIGSLEVRESNENAVIRSK